MSIPVLVVASKEIIIGNMGACVGIRKKTIRLGMFSLGYVDARRSARGVDIYTHYYSYA